MTKAPFFLLAAAMFLPFSPAHAEDTPAGNAAFLFAYHVKSGKEEQFAAGYREHLDWHRRNGDPLPWYGWTVSSGDRTGMFVDGSFGIAFAAFDNRIRPRDDGADFARTAAPYSEVAYRKAMRLMPHLGTATRLEDRNPSAAIEVVTVAVHPGKGALFESCLERLVTAVKGADRKPELTVYEQLSGGAQPSYLVMFPRGDYAHFETRTPSLDALIRAHVDAETGRELLAMLAESVHSAHVETWQYRADMSHLPQ